MSFYCYVTRAEFWPGSDERPISSTEWLEYVQEDPELELLPEMGKYFCAWTGEPDSWFDWSSGSIQTNWPSAAVMSKMLELATRFSGTVQDEDGTTYANVDDWERAKRPSG